MTSEEKRRWQWTCRGLMTETDRRNIRRFNTWLLLWVAGSAILTLAFEARYFGAGWYNWLLALIPSLFGIVGIVTYVRFLREADELLRKVQLEGVAIGFGAGAIFVLGYALFEQLGAPRLDTAAPMMVMFLFWAIGQWIGIRRYA